MAYLRTVDLARAVGAHPNTVRRYVDWGLLPPVRRAPNGYRLFTQHHLNCLRVARLIYSEVYPGRALRISAHRVIPSAIANEWDNALDAARAHLAFVQGERAQAEAAADLLEQWAAAAPPPPTARPLQIGAAARALDVSVDVLRNWERNGFIKVPRDPRNGYRLYGAVELNRLRVIRFLSRAGYSQMAILRMLLRLDREGATDLRRLLDTPAPDEDVYTVADRWLSTLAEQEAAALRLVAMVEGIRNSKMSPPPPRNA